MDRTVAADDKAISEINQIDGSGETKQSPSVLLKAMLAASNMIASMFRLMVAKVSTLWLAARVQTMRKFRFVSHFAARIAIQFWRLFTNFG